MTVHELTVHELMVKTNHYLIKGGILTDQQKDHIVRCFLNARNTPEELTRFYIGVRFPNNLDEFGYRQYPLYYIPPYNGGKKCKTILNQIPKTHILAANMYELEILRLCHLLAPNHEEVRQMIVHTLERLKHTTYGFDDEGVGECFDMSLVVLRFLITVAPREKEWIQSRINLYYHHFSDKKRPWYASWYFWLCLSEMPFEMAKSEIEKHKDEMLNWLYHKSCVMNSEHDQTIHPVLLSMLRNIIAQYPEYNYIKNRQPYVSEKDGRLHFDMRQV